MKKWLIRMRSFHILSNYASPSSGEAYRDRQLTTNFELKFFVCRHVSMWGFQNPVCLSICPYPEKRNHHSFVNISPTLVIDTSIERSSRVPQHGHSKIWIFFKKVRNWILTCAEKLNSPYLLQYQSYNSNWYINGKVFTSTTTWKHKMFFF